MVEYDKEEVSKVTITLGELLNEVYELVTSLRDDVPIDSPLEVLYEIDKPAIGESARNLSVVKPDDSEEQSPFGRVRYCVTCLKAIQQTLMDDEQINEADIFERDVEKLEQALA